MPSGTHDALPDDRNEHILVSVNGRLVPRAEASISVFDSGYLVGDGIWEAVRLHDGVLVFLDDHLDRLWAAAATTGIDIGLARGELTAELWKVLDANGMTDGVHVRFMVTRGTKRTPSQDPRLTVSGPNIVIIPEYKIMREGPGVRLFTSTIRRGGPEMLDPRLNCHSKLHEVMALNQALAAGADEALMLDPHGNVATCNSTNFFIVRRGEVWTSTGAYCLHGITRSKVLEVARAADIPAHEKDFSLFEVYSADEAFVTGTFGGLTTVLSVDGKEIGVGGSPVTARLRALYEKKVTAFVAAAARRDQA
ncbi:MAG TPA: aminotransferase class IV [Acidimicrobiia bacterium]|nr:aminotransferase class IV [Acidimicrobiia bacterium]